MLNIESSTFKIQHSFETSIAKIISYIFHPLLLPTYTILLIFNLNYFFSYIIPLKAKLLILANVFGFTVLLPIGIIYLLMKFSAIKSYEMQIKNERAIPLLITGMFYYLTYYLLKSISIPSLLTSFFFAITVVTLVTLVINISWKISLHATGLGSILGMLIALYLRFSIDTEIWIILLILLSGLTCFARLKLNSHSPAQVYTGYITGFALMFAFYSFIH